MSQALFDKIESEQFRKNPTRFNVGDTVRVHTKVVEGDKERIQIFTGVVIGMRGRGLNSTFTVRRLKNAFPSFVINFPSSQLPKFICSPKS